MGAQNKKYRLTSFVHLLAVPLTFLVYSLLYSGLNQSLLPVSFFTYYVALICLPNIGLFMLFLFFFAVLVGTIHLCLRTKMFYIFAHITMIIVIYIPLTSLWLFPPTAETCNIAMP